MPTPRIVVIHTGALGDTLLTFPALVWLRRWAPDARLTLIARRDTLPLALASGLADAAWPYDLPDWSALFADHPAPDAAEAGGESEADTASGAANAASETSARRGDGRPPLTPLTPLAQATLSGADLVVAWLADRDGAVARNLRALGVGRCIVAPGRPPGWNDARANDAKHQHAAAYLLGCLAPLSPPPPVAMPAPARDQLNAWLPRLRPSVEDQRGALAVWRTLSLPFAYDGGVVGGGVAGRVIALHPGSGGATKRWPPASFAALARAIAQAGDIPLLIEGPQDAEVVAEVMAAWRRDGAERTPLAVARGLGVGALAALLLRCTAYVGNDSGVAHLAGLLGLPTIALFGPTDPAVWGPLGPAVWTLRAPDGDLARLPPAQVMAGLAQALASSSAE